MNLQQSNLYHLAAKLDALEQRIQFLETENSNLRERVNVLEYGSLSTVLSIYDILDYIAIAHGTPGKSKSKMFPLEVRKILRARIPTELHVPMRVLHPKPFIANELSSYFRQDSARAALSLKPSPGGTRTEQNPQDVSIQNLLKVSVSSEAKQLRKVARDGFRTTSCRLLDEIEYNSMQNEEQEKQNSDEDRQQGILPQAQIAHLSKKYKHRISREKPQKTFSMGKNLFWMIPIAIILVPILVLIPLLSYIIYVISHPVKAWGELWRFLKHLTTLKFSEAGKDVSAICNSCFPFLKQIAMHRKRPKFLDLVGTAIMTIGGDEISFSPIINIIKENKDEKVDDEKEDGKVTSENIVFNSGDETGLEKSIVNDAGINETTTSTTTKKDESIDNSTLYANISNNAYQKKDINEKKKKANREQAQTNKIVNTHKEKALSALILGSVAMIATMLILCFAILLSRK